MACPARVRRATFQRGIFHGVSFARKIDWPIRLQRVVCWNNAFKLVCKEESFRLFRRIIYV